MDPACLHYLVTSDAFPHGNFIPPLNVKYVISKSQSEKHEDPRNMDPEEGF